jgi:hypothetical protein
MSDKGDKQVCFIAVYRSDKDIILSHCREFREKQSHAVHELVELAQTTGYPRRIGADV